MPWARASSLDRVIACPASAVLPVGKDERSEAAKTAADWGTLMHHYMAYGQVPNHPLQSKVLARAAYLRRQVLWPQDGIFERAFSLNVETWEVLTEDDLVPGDPATTADWKAVQPWECITGSADYCGNLLGTPWVDDLKTGRSPADPGEPQTLFYGLCLWLLNGKPDEGVVASITAFPRYPLVSAPVRKFKELSVEALTEFQAVLTLTFSEVNRYKSKLVQLGKRDVTPGGQCVFCPSKSNCPA